MLKFVLLVAASIAAASAGIIPEHHSIHTYHGLPTARGAAIIDSHSLHHHHHEHESILAHSPIHVAHAAPAHVVKVATPVVKYVSQPIVKYVAQPTIVKVAEPIILKSYPSVAHHHLHHQHAFAIPAYHHAGLHYSAAGHYHDLLH